MEIPRHKTLTKKELLDSLEAIIFNGKGLLNDEEIKIRGSKGGNANKLIITAQTVTIFDYKDEDLTKN